MGLFINYPAWMDPYVIDGLPVRWYAVMYIVAFGITYLLFKWQIKHDDYLKMSGDDGDMLFFWCILGLILGARIFSCIFYDDSYYYITHPWMMFWPFRNGRFVGLPGMSYHGGAFGCFVAGYFYCRKKKYDILRVTDVLVTGIPLGYTFGRLGNFINAELYGRVTTSSIGMLFPGAEGFSTTHQWVRNAADAVGIGYSYGDIVNLPRHPSQLYEAFFEGIVLFIILWFILRPLKYRHGWKDGTLFSAYIFGYGFFRFFIEYFREPDANLGYVIAGGPGSENIALFTSMLNISKGQVFCLIMVALSILLLIYVNCFRKPKFAEEEKQNGKRKNTASEKKAGRK